MNVRAIGLLFVGCAAFYASMSGPALPIYEALRRQVEERPAGPIDEEALPPNEIGDRGVAFAAGAMDALAGRYAGSGKGDWKGVKRAIDRINAG